LSWPDELDLIVVGDCNLDLIVHGTDVVPAFGQAEKLVDGMALTIGGSAAITAVAAARLGLRVALIAAIGADPAGELMLSLLAREGVDTAGVLVRPELPTGMTAVISTGADRAILTAVGAITSLAAADVVLTRPARHLHVSSYFLIERSLGPGLAGVLAAARGRGVVTSVDTNYDPSGRWGDQQLRSVLAETDVFLPNETEALGISGQPDLGRAAAALAGRDVVIKLGERGALCQPAGGHPSLVAVPPIRPVDTTGAGDCFNAGVIAGLTDGLDLPHAAALGCAVGAASTAAAGGTGARVDRDAAVELAGSATINPV
jgi:sugar/nucleoside kinase (ribokinase family)